jgi:hypothetical protein
VDAVRLVVLAVTLLAACGGAAPAPVAPSATSAAVSPVPAVRDVAAYPARPLPASGLDIDADAERVRMLVRAWSAGLDLHDVATLAPLYEDYVRLYGAESPTPKARVLDSKRNAFARTFRQQVIGPVEVVHEVGSDFTARFVKRSGFDGKVAEVHARLRVRAKVDGRLVIVEESDEPSDTAVRARRAGTDGCLAAAAAAVHEVREIADFERRASAEADASGGKIHVGGFGPQELGEGKFGVGMGFQSEDRFDGRVWYQVDRQTGHIELTIDGATLAVAGEAEATVKAACARP